eukprot:g19056.t1
MRKLYGINADDYVDDFPMFVKRGLGKAVVEAMLELLEELGLPAMVEKVDYGVELEVLGLMFCMAHGEPELYLTEKKKEQVKSMCSKASSLYWCEVVKNSSKPWIVRVPSRFNIADYPTRCDLMEYINTMCPNLFSEFHEGFGLGEFFDKALAGEIPDCMLDLARGFTGAADVAADSDEDCCG